MHTSGLKKALAMKAVPDAFLQLLQWQTRKVKGSPVISYWTELHRQDPWYNEDIVDSSTGNWLETRTGDIVAGLIRVHGKYDIWVWSGCLNLDCSSVHGKWPWTLTKYPCAHNMFWLSFYHHTRKACGGISSEIWISTAFTCYCLVNAWSSGTAESIANICQNVPMFPTPRNRQPQYVRMLHSTSPCWFQQHSVILIRQNSEKNSLSINPARVLLRRDFCVVSTSDEQLLIASFTVRSAVHSCFDLSLPNR